MHRLSKPAERFINPSAAGIPTIGDAHHVSNVEIVAGAARRGAAKHMELLLAQNTSDFLEKSTTVLRSSELWQTLQRQAMRLAAPFGRAATLAKYALLRERAMDWRREKGGHELYEPA